MTLKNRTAFAAGRRHDVVSIGRLAVDRDDHVAQGDRVKAHGRWQAARKSARRAAKGFQGTIAALPLPAP